MMFYQHLKDLRKLKGYTISEVADRSGVSPAYISQLENGTRNIPSPEIIQKLSEGLNVSYTELMGVAGYLEYEEKDNITKAPVNLRRFLRNNDIVFDGIHLTDVHKEWVERILTALFWKEKQEGPFTYNESDQ